MDVSGRSPPQNVSRFQGNADVVVGVVAVLAGAVAFVALGDGSVARLLLVAPVVLVVPGYLLAEAASRGRTVGRERWAHALIGLGISPAIVGLAALATAVVPGGFQAPAIVAIVTLTCLSLAWIVLERRQRLATEAAPDAVARPRATGGRA